MRVALLLICLPALAAEPLPPLGAEKAATVSGVSSGAYMAVQFHVAHSATVTGASARCRVHVAFHGCRQAMTFVGDKFMRDAGYNRWADANRLIVLYPQAIASYWWPYNPRGCWDWWGYTGAQYHTKEGAQIRAVKAMLDRLSAPRQ